MPGRSAAGDAVAPGGAGGTKIGTIAATRQRGGPAEDKESGRRSRPMGIGCLRSAKRAWQVVQPDETLVPEALELRRPHDGLRQGASVPLRSQDATASDDPMRITNDTFLILISTRRHTERYYRDEEGWLKVSTRGRVFPATAEQVLNHLLPALAGLKAGLGVTVEHHGRGYRAPSSERAKARKARRVRRRSSTAAPRRA